MDALTVESFGTADREEAGGTVLAHGFDSINICIASLFMTCAGPGCDEEPSAWATCQVSCGMTHGQAPCHLHDCTMNRC